MTQSNHSLLVIIRKDGFKEAEEVDVDVDDTVAAIDDDNVGVLLF
jgi:hypothetical protein